MIFDADSNRFQVRVFRFGDRVGTPIMTRSACLIIDGSVVASILLPGVAFQFINRFLVSPVPESSSCAWKMLRPGGADITETRQHKTVLSRSFLLETTEADSFGKLHAIITRLEQKYIGEKGVIEPGGFW